MIFGNQLLYNFQLIPEPREQITPLFIRGSSSLTPNHLLQDSLSLQLMHQILRNGGHQPHLATTNYEIPQVEQRIIRQLQQQQLTNSQTLSPFILIPIQSQYGYVAQPFLSHPYSLPPPITNHQQFNSFALFPSRQPNQESMIFPQISNPQVSDDVFRIKEGEKIQRINDRFLTTQCFNNYHTNLKQTQQPLPLSDSTAPSTLAYQQPLSFQPTQYLPSMQEKSIQLPFKNLEEIDIKGDITNSKKLLSQNTFLNQRGPTPRQDDEHNGKHFHNINYSNKHKDQDRILPDPQSSQPILLPKIDQATESIFSQLNNRSQYLYQQQLQNSSLGLQKPETAKRDLAFNNNNIQERQGKYTKCCSGNSFEANQSSSGITLDQSNRAQIGLQNPRASIEERMRQVFKISEDSKVQTTPGEHIDLSHFEGKVHIPDTRTFSSVKFTNPATGRIASVFTCDHQSCGKYFRKWHNLFDHLRVHTNQKPFPCPVLGCNKVFNQVSNQKKHIDTHRSKPFLKCSVCRERFARTDIIEHYYTHNQSDSEQ